MAEVEQLRTPLMPRTPRTRRKRVASSQKKPIKEVESKMRDDPASSTSSGISQPSLEARALSEEEIDREMALLRYWSDHPEERVARIKELDPSWRRMYSKVYLSWSWRLIYLIARSPYLDWPNEDIAAESVSMKHILKNKGRGDYRQLLPQEKSEGMQVKMYHNQILKYNPLLLLLFLSSTSVLSCSSYRSQLWLIRSREERPHGCPVPRQRLSLPYLDFGQNPSLDMSTAKLLRIIEKRLN